MTLTGSTLVTPERLTGWGCHSVLELARKHLGMEIALVGRLGPTGHAVAEVAPARPADPTVASRTLALQEHYDELADAGVWDELVLDAATDARLRDLEVTHRLGARGYLAIPIYRSDTSLVGVLCAYSRSPRPAVGEHARTVLRFVAEVVTQQLDPDTTTDVGQRRSNIRRLMAQGQPDLVFQPIISLQTGDVAAFEALARFAVDPYEAPDRWFAAAHAAGAGPELEAAVIERAMRTLPQIPSSVRLSINVSAMALAEPVVQDLLARSCLERVILEITEHERVIDLDRVTVQLARLQTRGAIIAMDDLGAGYAGLQRVLDLRPGVLKLDGGLVRGTAVDPARRAVVAATVQYAAAQMADVVAEGVEDEPDREVLRELGVGYAQGHLFGSPGPLVDASLN